MTLQNVGVFFIALGLLCGWMAYRGYKGGNMTLSAIAPAYRDKQPINFWVCMGVMLTVTAVFLIVGVSNVLGLT
jgi:uncharacterized membrane protein YidH (DUF202 family)